MANTRRIMTAGIAVAASVAVVAALGSARAFGDERVTTLVQPGDPVQERLFGADTYQLSLDGGRTWSDAKPQAKQLLLRSRTFDPAAGAAEAERAPGNLRAATTAGAYLVQFAA